MEQQLRLADRRGRFNGFISPPGEFGLMILMMLDDQREVEDDVNMVKAAILSNDPTKLRSLFPQWFTPEELEEGTEEAEEALASGNAVEDYSGVTWMSPSDANGDVEEMMRLAEALAANATVSVTQDAGGDWV